MLVMTARVDKKKILIAVGALILAIGVLMGIVGGNEEPSTPTATATEPVAASNDDRVKFLTDLGWEVSAVPTETMQVRIPSQTSELYERYNELQKSQGYDLSRYAGKTVNRYVYQINNYPGATQPVYATLLVYRDQIIGGDITDTSPNGKVQGFNMAQ